jgi:hypothetical protein
LPDKMMGRYTRLSMSPLSLSPILDCRAAMVADLTCTRRMVALMRPIPPGVVAVVFFLFFFAAPPPPPAAAAGAAAVAAAAVAAAAAGTGIGRAFEVERLRGGGRGGTSAMRGRLARVRSATHEE